MFEAKEIFENKAVRFTPKKLYLGNREIDVEQCLFKDEVVHINGKTTRRYFEKVLLVVNKNDIPSEIPYVCDIRFIDKDLHAISFTGEFNPC